jgi:outer membrane protein assembly factor BamB
MAAVSALHRCGSALLVRARSRLLFPLLPNAMNPLRFLFVLTACTCTASTADWPQWRGKDRMDHSPDSATLVPWPDGGPARLWLFDDAGLGYSGFSIVGGQLFTMSAKDGAEQVLSLDAASGEKRWSVPLDNRIYPNRWGDGPRCTPTIDVDRCYALSANGILGCLAIADGRILWKVDLVSDFGGKLQNWGYTESVLVDGDRVVCTPGGSKGTMLALDKMTGKPLWQSKSLQDEAQYSSPILVEHGGQRQYVQLIGKKIFGAKADDGAILWQADFPGRTAVIPTSIYSDGHVYVTAGYDAGCRRLKLGGATPELVYENKIMGNHHGGVILVDGKVYGHSDKGGWTCQDLLSGEAVWQDKSLGKGACTYVAGHLVCLEESSGNVTLVEASTAGWKEKGRFKLDPQTKLRKPQGRIWVHPVVLDGRLYLRDQDLVYCYNVKAK